ncbi:MAG TPA: hypothetical protein VK832_22610 [Burkholderiaceae bacterium]|nr:hypothetical protein [Burkholderiaceae bacterium]
MSNQAADTKSVTIENLESALASESMAHIRYRASYCRRSRYLARAVAGI